MNLRVIKKDIEFFIGEFIEDCSLFVALNPDKASEGIAEVISAAVDLYNDLRDKVNCLPEGLVTKPGKHASKEEIAAIKNANAKAQKAYYKGICKELFEQLDALSEKLSEVICAA